MKPSRLPICTVFLSFACVQGPPSLPPPTPVAEAAAVNAPVTAPQADATPPTVAAAPSSVQGTAVSTPSTRPEASSSNSSSRPAGSPSMPSPGAAPPRVRLDIPTGTRLPVEIQTALSSATSKPGDFVLAVLTESVVLNGFKLDQGAEVRGQVRTAMAATKSNPRGRLVVDFDAVMEDGERLVIVTEAVDTAVAFAAGKDRKREGAGAPMVLRGDEVEVPRGARWTLVVIK